MPHTTGPFTVRLMPGPHHVFTSGAAYTWFKVANDGTFDYDAALDGALTGRGTSTLAVDGREVTFDVRALGLSSASVDYAAHDAAEPLTVRLNPGQHHIYTTSTGYIWFHVGADGTIDDITAAAGILTGLGTRRLAFLPTQ